MTPSRAGSSQTTGEAPASGLEERLQPTLHELEQIRLETVRKIRDRMRLGIPLGLGVGLAFGIFTRSASEPFDISDLLIQAGAGGLIGWGWASHKLRLAYKTLYKSRVLSQLASQFGELTYRSTSAPNLDRLEQEKIFRAFDDAYAEDAIEGVYRGLAIKIVELKLTVGSGRDQRTVFDGLLTEVQLPRRLVGTTAVISDRGMFGNLGDRLLRSNRQRIQLEDSRFEAAYEVYGDDQISARALLTPAFMERFMALGDLEDFAQPVALAQDNRLTLAMPKRRAKDLFEPPSYKKPAHSRQALAELHADIAAVLGAADAVIDLDQSARKSRAVSPA